ncbi:MAG: response regulator [Smithellaceae bacterium]|nr:response regulator [Smithellaceae bacterium]
MSRGSILVVDDEASIRELLRDYFSDAGYEVVTAAGGREALDKFIPGKFDCVICDLSMPECDGMEVLKTITRLDSQVIFFMVTGFPSIDSAIKAMKVGAYDYITKPFHLEDVLLKIERATNAKNTGESLKKVTGLFWGVIISIPIWLILGVILGILWKK